MPINDKQRRKLKGLAHNLKPVVIVGQHGLSEAVLKEIDAALEAHELIKVRLNAADRDDRAGMIGTVASDCHAELINSIGHVAVFYRRHPKRPKIELAE